MFKYHIMKQSSEIFFAGSNSYIQENNCLRVSIDTLTWFRNRKVFTLRQIHGISSICDTVICHIVQIHTKIKGPFKSIKCHPDIGISYIKIQEI